VDFDVTDQLMIRFFAFLHGSRVTVYQLIIDFKKTSYSVRREVLYSILTEFGVPVQLVRLIKCV
jgi:hypothetical protein